MVQTRYSSRPRSHHVFLVGALLTLSLALTSHASGTVAEAKAAPSRTRGTTRQAKTVSPTMIKTAGTRPSAGLHRDLLNLEEGQTGIQRQLENLTSETRRHTDALARRIDSLMGQLNRLASAQQQITGTQQLLAATIRSIRMLLVVIVGFLLVLCGALLFGVYQLRQFGALRLNDLQQIGRAPVDAPDRAFESQWKVSS
jgi:ABC-type Fe3+-siderophore transport system permease subunit